jgi:hypothetical protein
MGTLLLADTPMDIDDNIAVANTVTIGLNLLFILVTFMDLIQQAHQPNQLAVVKVIQITRIVLASVRFQIDNAHTP